MTILLVEGFTGLAGDDLDTDNDGVLDITPWTTLVDDMGLTDGGVDDAIYSATVLAPGYDGNSFTPAGASRIPDGADTDTDTDWTRNDFDGEGLPGFIGTPDPGEAINTPDLPNEAVSVEAALPRVNEVVRDHTGSDTSEYVEIFGDPSTDYSAYTLLELEGDGTGAGVIDGVWPLGVTDGSGIWFTGFLNSEIENGSVTLLVVDGFTGLAGDDLDTDNDGVLDTMPWTAVVDDVGLTDGGVDDRIYSTTVLAPGYDGNSFTPGGASRIPDGADTDTTADWVRNDFDGEGLPGFIGTPDPGEALNTPELPNEVVPALNPPVLNEVVRDHTGSDTSEYVELFGDPSVDYSSYSILEVEGDSGSTTGVIDGVWAVGTTDAAGIWFTGFLNSEIENGSVTLLLVEGFTGVAGDDLDTDDDGVFDVMPWTAVVDDVALTDGGVDDRLYSVAVLAPGYDGNSFTPGGASRIPDGADTDAAGDWVRNDFDGEGLPGFIGTPDPGEALNTPGLPNEIVVVMGADPVINEFVRDHTGGDTSEFVELFGDPAADYSALTILEIEGDVTSATGTVDSVLAVGIADGAGFWFTGYLNGEFENGTVTLLLVENFTGSAGDDLDTDDDGVFDVTPWDRIVDDVAATDGTAGDLAYSATVLAPSYDGNPFTPGGASRIPDGMDTDTTADWVRNDFDGEGLPGFTGTPEVGEALNTGGLPNEIVEGQPPVTATICEIQGSGDFSPLDGQVVTTLDNIVTVVAVNGFFLQTAASCDGDPATSDGIFVFSDPPTVLPGDQVDVTGVVDEFFDKTELTGVTVTVDSSGNPIPAAVVFDASTPSPVAPGDKERYEGMRVAWVDGVVTSPSDRFGDAGVVAKSTPLFREPGIEYPGLVGLPVWDGNPEGFEVDPDCAGLANLDLFRGQAVLEADGALDFQFGDYIVCPSLLAVGPEPALPVPARDRAEGEATVASLNMLRLFDEIDDPLVDDFVEDPLVVEDRLTRFSAYIRDVMKSPDVLLVQEVENLSILQRVADRIAADDPAIVYTAYLDEGNDIGGIDVGYLVRDTSTVFRVQQVYKDLTWEFDGVVSLLHDRPPLVLGVDLGGRIPIHIVNLHQRSLGGIDDDADGDRVRNKRFQQAATVSTLLRNLYDRFGPDLRLVVGGDFNAFEFTDGYADVLGQIKGLADPLGALIPVVDIVNPDYEDLVLDLPAEERYTFVFGGSGQVLDHFLVSPGLRPLVSELEIPRGNADAPEGFEDTPRPGQETLSVSDHDGIVLFLQRSAQGQGGPLVEAGLPGER